MLFKLSLANIAKSIKDYAIYFFTLILGVSIFYVFNAIETQTVLLEVTSSTSYIIKMMTNILSGVSIFVSFILGFLIIYASRFLIARRKKEFGIYLTLGMSKKKISFILLLETLIIGIASLAVGLLLGIALSQLMSLFVASMFEANMTKFKFLFSQDAFVKTLIYFGIMYIIVMIFNTYSIGKCRLIDLLHGNKHNEKIRLKNPVLCTIIFFISCIALGYAYYMVTGGVEKIQNFDFLFVLIAIGSMSTFFIFWSLSGLVLKICLGLKKFYYKGLNSFVLRQFSSKINTMVMSMTVICLMLFVTICVLASSLSIKNSMLANLDELAPADIEFEKNMNYAVSEPEKLSTLQRELIGLDVRDSLKKMDIDLMPYIDEFVEIDIYNIPELTLAKTFGDNIQKILENYRFLETNTPEEIIKISEYNRLAKFYGLEEHTLNDDEYMIIADFVSFVQLRDEALASGTTLDIRGHLLHPKYTQCQNGFIEMSSNHINNGVIVVPDAVLTYEVPKRNYFIANYAATTKEEKRKIEENIVAIMSAKRQDPITINGTSRLTIAEASIGLGALVTFIGLYLGIIFLISSAAVLALKELSESADNKERFRMIRKLGADERQINDALFKQIGIIFVVPLLLASIHSIFGMKFSTFILEAIGTKELLSSIIMTVCFLAFIYGTYFAITYLSSKNIIKEKI